VPALEGMHVGPSTYMEKIKIVGVDNLEAAVQYCSSTRKSRTDIFSPQKSSLSISGGLVCVCVCVYDWSANVSNRAVLCVRVHMCVYVCMYVRVCEANSHTQFRTPYTL